MSWVFIDWQHLYCQCPELFYHICILFSYLIPSKAWKQLFYRLEDINSRVLTIISKQFLHVTTLPELDNKRCPILKHLCHQFEHHIAHNLPLIKQHIQLGNEMAHNKRWYPRTGRCQYGAVIQKVLRETKVDQTY